jgi:hypothetical protein
VYISYFEVLERCGGYARGRELDLTVDVTTSMDEKYGKDLVVQLWDNGDQYVGV